AYHAFPPFTLRLHARRGSRRPGDLRHPAGHRRAAHDGHRQERRAQQRDQPACRGPEPHPHAGHARRQPRAPGDQHRRHRLHRGAARQGRRARGAGEDGQPHQGLSGAHAEPRERFGGLRRARPAPQRSHHHRGDAGLHVPPGHAHDLRTRQGEPCTL
ncbi:MAG: hypothetical protein AVDCRST_MAG68-2248, partial [uncultured Gemmatimonadetes bacterium]